MGLAGNMQCLQPAIRILEHLVSEDQSPSLVHFVSDGAGSSLALILLLPWRRFFKLVSLQLNGLFILGASYVLVLCMLNLVDTHILHHQPTDNN